MDGWIDGRIDGWMKKMDGWMDEWIEGIEGIDRWMDGWLDGRD